MGFQLIVIIAVSFFATAAQATTDQAQWIFDQNQMPRCVVDGSRVFSFQWNRDPYERRILVKGFYLNEQSHMSPPDRATKPHYMRLFDAYCSPTQPRTYISGRWKTQEKWTLSSRDSWLNPGENEISGIKIPESIRKAFDQVALGGNLYREKNAVEIARELPNSGSLESNAELTQKYGVGFSAEVYRATVELNPRNQNFKKNLDDRIKKNREVTQFPQTLPFTVMVVKGFGYSLTNNRLFRDLITDLQGQIGAEVIDVDVKSFGTVDESAKIVRDEMEKVLSGGRDIMIVAGCVGAAEALIAMAELRPDIEGHSRKANYGRVLAFLGLSPMIGGSFIADWATAFPQGFFVSLGVHAQFKKLDPNVGSRGELSAAIYSLSEKALKEKIENLSSRVPRSTVYFSLVGVKTGNALAGDENMRGMQDEMIRRIIFKTKGFAANDGFIRYPGSMLPDDWDVEHYAAVAEASHALLDGSYGQYSLKPGSRDRVVVIRSLLELLNERAQQKSFH